ncbi:MAG: hypothetical protein ACTTIZ_07930 [Treponema sp.]
MRIKLLIIIFFIFISFNVFSQEESVEEKENEAKTPQNTTQKTEKETVKKPTTYPSTFQTDLSLMALYPWGFVIDLSETLEVPLLRFDNPLTHSNSLKFTAGVNLTPVTFELNFKATFTPIAFLNFYAGSGIGTGWSFSRFHGFAKNIDDGTGKSKKIAINGKDFFFNTRFGTKLQFDLGAVLNNKWSHVVLLIDQGFKYFGAANMTSHDSWVYKEDYGESRNSWLYTASYTIGYLMPIPLKFIGLLIETEKKLYTEPSNKSDWGDQYMYAYITPIIIFEATKYLNIAISPQFFTRKNYTKPINTFYEKNTVNEKKPHYVEFYRIAIACIFTFQH